MAWRNRDETRELAGIQLTHQATASLAGLLAERNVTRGQLAQLMGVSAGRVSQILSGDENLTLKSLASIASSLDASVEVRFFDAPLAGQPDRNEAGVPGGPAQPYVPSGR
ncbi:MULTISPECIES: helix-turn-helix domain-containing protein [unclassified Streptomyces]|uniref:helix-turn-helix domain-containing protein n=1 Tax=unclassified Streptomyces TaxID=2593676 RepID=UPI00324383FF